MKIPPPPNARPAPLGPSAIALLAALWSGAALAQAAPECAHSARTAPLNGKCIDIYQRRGDFKIETYYGAGSPLISTAFEYLVDYWNRQGRVANIQDHDSLIPPELFSVRHGPATEMERAIGETMAAKTQNSTHLVPSLALAPLQNVRLPMLFGQLVTAVPTTPGLLSAAEANTAATQLLFGKNIAGVYPLVDAGTGLASTPVLSGDPYHCAGDLNRTRAFIATIGQGLRGMVEVMIATGHTSYWPWINDRLNFLETTIDPAQDPTFNPNNVRLLPDGYTQTGACMVESPSTDNHYLARDLIAAVQEIDSAPAATRSALTTLRAHLCDRGLKLARGWRDLGFDPVTQHFITHVNYDGSQDPLAHASLYGDSKWNALFLMAAAAEIDPSNAPSYLERAYRHYSTLAANAHSTLIDCSYDQGSVGGDGLAENESIIMADALLRLARVSEALPTNPNIPSGYFRQAAVSLTNRTLAARGQSGCSGANSPVLNNSEVRTSAALIRLAFGLENVHRLEVDTTGPQSSFTVYRCGLLTCLENVLSATLPRYSEVGVVYLPDARYAVVSNGVIRYVTLNADRLVTF